jgi:hypothetical protein
MLSRLAVVRWAGSPVRLQQQPPFLPTVRAMADFTRRRLQWLNTLAKDGMVSPVDFRVAYIITSFANNDSGLTCPAQATIARAAHLKTRAIRNAIGRLVAAGHLRVEVMRGPGNSNRYIMNENRHHDAGIEDTDNRHDGADIEVLKPARRCRITQNKTGTVKQENRHADDTKTGTVVPTELTNELTFELSGGKSLVRTQKSSKPARHNSSIPESCPTEHDLAQAQEYFEQAGHLDLAVKVESIAGAFRDHHLSKGSTFKDWSAAWRTWCRNEIKFKRGDARPTGAMSAVAGIFVAARTAEDR